MRYRLDDDVRRQGGGRVLVGGSPLALMRLSERGAGLVERLERGEGGPWTAGERHLIDRLLDRGMAIPMPGLAPDAAGSAALTVDDVTVVVPAFGRVESLRRCLGALRADPTSADRRILVVDDASPDGAELAEVAGRWGSEVVRLESNRGPAAARNAGLAAVGTALVAFVDTDVEVGPDWLAWAVRWFADEGAVLVAPRVVSGGRGGVLARYESSRSPLDLGVHQALVRARSRVAYVPAAALVVRVDALRDIGGFDESLRVGEDVDLCWRLAGGGGRCWYLGDESIVRHEHRPSLRAAARQRFGYGTSAAALDARHPGAVAPLGVSGWSVAAWGATAAGHPVLGAAVAAVTAAALERKLDQLEPGTASGLALRGHLGAGELLARALLRPWWPITLAAALVSRRVRRVVIAAVLVPPLLEWRRRRPHLDPFRWTMFSMADDVAYSAGVWRGAWTMRSAGALVPEIRSWPGRRAGDAG